MGVLQDEGAGGTLSVVRSVSSALMTSIGPVRGKGVGERREKVSCWLTGRSSGRRGGWGSLLGCATLLLRSVTDGRGVPRSREG